MRRLSILAVATLGSITGAVGMMTLSGAETAWSMPASPNADGNPPIGDDYTRYDGPVASCPGDPRWKPGEVYLMTPCDGQHCFEGGVWICHLTPDDRPEMKAKRQAAEREKQLKYKALVDNEVLRLGGEYRRAEAERLVKMREDAEAARLRAQPALRLGNSAQPVEATTRPTALPKPPVMCSYPSSNATMDSDYFDNKTLAAAGLRKRLIRACSFGVNGTIAGPIQCRTLPSVTFANGTRAPSSECQVRYSCPAYQAPCAGKGGGKPARARAG